MRAILGAEPRSGVLLGVTDSCWLTKAGIPTLPAFGCGSLAVAHRPNEWIPAGDLGTAIDLTEALVRGYATALVIWIVTASNARAMRYSTC